jgi:hypothetical protein
MLKYIIKTEIDGTEIRLIYSKAPDKFYVIYGLEQKEFNTITSAKGAYDNSVQHALECGAVV